MRPMGIMSLFFFLFSHHCFVSNTQNFSSNISICGNLTIQYPFKLQSQNTQQNPNYNNFSLTCTDQGNTLLTIPFSGDFLVQEINYSTKEIKLQNPSNFLPRKLLHLNLFSSPFAELYISISWNWTSRETSNYNVPTPN